MIFLWKNTELSIQESRKKYHGFHKKLLRSKAIFNIDNEKKYFLSSKSAY